MLLAQPAYANVVINEIAWMGGTQSVGGASDEWIELYNPDATAVDLSGFAIVADDGSPSIPLSGTIGAFAYVLIERTNDSAVPNVTADIVTSFGNGLSNGGETLRLKNAQSIDIDVVVGGTDWGNIGGNNTTKETAQRTSNSWITGSPTPRAMNIAQAGEVLGSTSKGTTQTIGNTSENAPPAPTPVSKSTSPAGLYPRKNIVVEAGDDRRAFTGFQTTFTGSSSGLYNEALDRATYRWNFGDGATGDERVSTHRYQFAGEYVATLEVFWSTYRVSDRLTVTVLNPDVIIGKVVGGESGFIELINLTSREIDLSGWVLSGAGPAASFVLPPNSTVLANKKFVLPNSTSGIGHRDMHIVLAYPHGGIASEWRESGSVGVVPKESKQESKQASQIERSTSAVTHTSVSPTPKLLNAPQVAAVGSVAKKVATGTTAGASVVLWQKGQKDAPEFGQGASTLGYNIGGGMKWVFIMLTLLLIVFAGFVISRSHVDEVTIADEYAIIEDIIEGKDDIPEKRLI